MKPHWDQLMSDFADHPHALIADCDCTGKCKSLCSKVGVASYPTLKWGDPTDLQAYEGGRELEDLQTFAMENLKPMCSVVNVELCDADKKAEINALKAMPKKDLQKAIKKLEKKVKRATKDFGRLSKKVQKEVAKVEKKKEAKMAALGGKHADLPIMKMVMAFRESSAS